MKAELDMESLQQRLENSEKEISKLIEDYEEKLKGMGQLLTHEQEVQETFKRFLN